MTKLPPPVPASQRVVHSQQWRPVDFRFPASFEAFIVDESLPDLRRVFFLAASDANALPEWSAILARQFPSRVLVPFAKDDDSDDVFCFDGADVTGDPAVLMIHSFTTPGAEYRGEWTSFDSWLAAAEDAHIRWENDE